MLLAAVVLASTGCRDAAASHAEPTTRPSSTSSRTVSTDELSLDQAQRNGLLRDDAVDVAGPDEVRSGGKVARMSFRVTVPVATRTDSIVVEQSGDCIASLDGAPAGARSITVPVSGGVVDVFVSASVPSGADHCDVTIDALAPNRPDTGSGHTATLRR
jgi:hypothetical protein